ncbi:MAG: hypothetical protein GEU91_05905 [Rhizobiales bacterium]|nr:hypothetical protein [Hyphomicrobiales bacterium]
MLRANKRVQRPPRRSELASWPRVSAVLWQSLLNAPDAHDGVERIVWSEAKLEAPPISIAAAFPATLAEPFGVFDGKRHRAHRTELTGTPETAWYIIWCLGAGFIG